MVKWHIASLRGKLEVDPHSPMQIITVWGVGYRYDVPAVEADPSDSDENESTAVTHQTV